MASPPSTFHADDIAQALATEGGHLRVGRYGATLYFGDGCRLHTHTDEIKAECVAAGLPVIDSRPVPIEVLADLVMRGPEVRVGPKRSEPHWQFAYEPPWGAFSFAPLEYVVELYRAAGAEVMNLPPPASPGLSEPTGTGPNEPVLSSVDMQGLEESLRYDPAGAPVHAAPDAVIASRLGAEEDELLGVILQLCAPRGAPGGLGRELLARFGSLSGVLVASPEALMAVGASDCTAADLRLLKRITLGLAQRDVRERPIINSWNALLDYVRLQLRDERRERFHVLFLDKRLRLIRDERLGSGTVDHAPVYPREVIRRALELSASALILVHNHPSGDARPSSADIEITRQVSEAGRLLGITVHDHLVVGGSEVTSFRTLGVL